MRAGGLLRLLRQQLRRYAGLVGLWTTARLAILVGGLLLQQLFDRLTSPEPAGWTVASLIALVLAADLGRVQLWYGVILGRVEASYTYGIRADLRSAVLRTLLGRPAAVALDRPIGDVLSRLGGDVDEVGVYAIWSASNIARMIIAIGAVAIMASINLLVTVGVVVPLLLVITLGRAMNKRLGRYRAAARQAAAEVSTAVGEAINAAQAIQVAGAQRRVVDRMRATNRVRARVTVREQTFAILQEALFDNAAILGTGLLLLLAAGQLRSGAFTVGDLALFIFYLDFLSEAVWALGMFFVRSRQAALSMQRLGELTDRPVPAVRPGTSDGDGDGDDLRVTGLGYRYPSGGGIEDVTLTFPAGSLTVITGRVGAGKTTLIRTLLGILPAQTGETVRPASWAYTPQAPTLFSGSVRENIELGRPADADRLARVIRTAAFEQDLQTFPDAVATVLGPRGLRLSGGQLKRVAAARALYRDAQLLVFDDLADGLDHETEARLWDAVLAERSRAGVTIIAVSHNPGLLRWADQVVVLEAGRVAAVGDYAEVTALSATP